MENRDTGKAEKSTADKHRNKTYIYSHRHQLWDPAAAGTACCHLVISNGTVASERMSHSAGEAKKLLLKQPLIMALPQCLSGLVQATRAHRAEGTSGNKSVVRAHTTVALTVLLMRSRSKRQRSVKYNKVLLKFPKEVMLRLHPLIA